MVKSFKLFFSSLILSISLIMSSASPVLALSFPAEINKEFTPIQIDPGETSILRVYIYNPNSFQLTNAGWTDNLVGVQPGMYLVAPGLVSNTCGGAVTAVPGQTTFSLSGGTVPAQSGPTPGQCYVEVAVSSITPGNLINTIGTGLVNGLNAKGNDGGTIVDITNTTPASATLVVSTVTPPTLTKSYSSTNIFVGQTSRLTITLNNNDTTTNLSGVSYTDNLPVGTRFGNQLILATPVNATITGCGGYSLTANPGGTQIALTNATVTPSVNCVVAVDVTGLADQYSNVIPAGPGAPAIQSDQGVTNPAAATAQLNIQPVRVTKSFSPTSFQVGGTTTLTIRIQNPTASAYTNVTNNGAALDALPAPFVVAPTPGVTNSCVGSVTAAAGSSNISISGLTVPGGSVGAPGECLITVQVTATAAASNVTNTIASGTLASPDHPTLTNFPNSTATISAYAVGVGLTGAKSFSPTTIDPGQNTRLRIDLTAPLDTNLTNFSVTDDLSLIGLTITNSTPASKTANCIGGTLTATTGTNIITWAGGTINAGQLCRIEVYVTSNTAGAVTNRITPAQISNTENRDPAADITAVLNVTQPSDLSVSKLFSPNLVVPSGITRLRITIQNTNALPITGLSVLDDLASMGSGSNAVRVAPTPNGFTDCGGTFAPVAGASTVSLTGGTVPPQIGGVPGICTIEVNVRAQSSSTTRTNTITNTNVSGQVQGSGTTIFAPINATATLQTTALSLVINKEFDPNLVYGGASSELRVILDNPSATVALTGIAFTDDMTLLGSGMVLANPVSLNVGTCGGTLTGNPGDTSFSFSGGTLAAGATCTLTLRATLTVNGNITNRIPAGSVTTLQGATNAMPVEASLSNLAGASVGKAFSPGVIIAGSGDVSTLTITINNTTGLTLTQVGLVDNLPVGLNIAAAPAAINNCSTGSLTAMAGTQLIELIGGTLGPNSSCTLVVPVTSDVPGSYTNTIPINTLKNTEGYTNTEPAEDTLIVTGFSLGNRVWEDNGAGGGTADDGVRNGTEPSIDGVTVNLYRDSDNNGTPDGAAIATMNTAGGGFYRFDNLKADTYIVEVVTPAGFSSSTVDAGDADADVDDDDDNGVVISGVNVRSNPVTLGPTANEPTGETNPATNPEAGEAVDNQSNRTVDFGFVTSYSLGNRVWDDNGAGGGTASDGLRNGTEPGLDGVTVNLYRDSDDNGTPDGAVITTTTTSGGGFYRFDGLRADTYIVEVVAPAGYTSTIDAGDPDVDVDDDDDNGVVISGANIRSNPVTLGPGNSEPTGETNPATNPELGEAVDNRSNRTVDFGFITSYSLGNRVWDDNGAGGGTASDGLRNGTEPGIDGVTVNLYRDSDDNGTPDGAAIATMNTAGGGFYRFDGLRADTYIVEVVPPAGYTSTVDAGDPDTDAGDDDDNGVVISGANIRSNPVTLGPGTAEPTGENNPATNPEAGEANDNQSNRTVDFGFVTAYSLGNRVWMDDGTGGGTANDGVRNGTELGIDGVTVNLYRDSDNNGTPDGAAIATMNTAGGGFYRFDNLRADTYIVEVVIPTGTTSTVDAGDPDTDVDDDDDNGVVIVGANVRSNPVTLGPGNTEPTGENNPAVNPEAGEAADNRSNRTVDFGFVTSYSLGNRVWEDTGVGGGTANDGLRNGTEPGIDGVTVNLYRDSDNNGTPDGVAIATMNTAGGGFYRFDNLTADTYIVEVIAPTGYTSSTVDAGDPDADVDDDDDNGVVISGSSVRSNPVTLGPGAVEPTGETNPAVNPEAGEAVDNQSNRTVDFGFYFIPYSLGNRVWMDDGTGGGTASDGVRNGTEPGIDGVAVNLYRDSDNNGTPDGAVIATMNTAGGGFYRFDNLRADTYIVEVVIPTGTTSTVDAGDPDTDVDDDDDNGVVIVGANVRSNPVTLGPGNSEPTGETNPAINPEVGEATDDHSNRTVDFGFITSYSLGNRVWADTGSGGGTANDGLRNGGEPGINGVTINLYRDSDNNSTPDGAAIATTTTAGGGFYRFDNLTADTYIVEAIAPTGYTSSTVDAGDPDADVDDDDDNGVLISGSSVRSNPVTLGPGAVEPTGENNPVTNPETGESVDSQSNRTVDFGFYFIPYSLGNRVWMDDGTGGGTANDGVRNGTEPGIDGVAVNLYRDSDNNSTPDGAAINTTTTSGGGFYRFDDLIADTYIVEVVTPTGTTSTVDAGDPDSDVDDDDDNGVIVSGANMRSNPVTLGPGASEPTGETNPAINPEAGEATDDHSNRTVDFGFVTGYSLGNRVWMDDGAGGGTANDGLRNGTEPGIDNVTVRLYRDSDDNGTPDGAAIATMNTSGGGFYRFDGLRADTYIVEVIPPTGYNSTVDAGDPDTDTNDDDDNGVVISGSNIRSNPVTLGPGASEPTGETNPTVNPEAGEAADNQSNRTVDFGFVQQTTPPPTSSAIQIVKTPSVTVVNPGDSVTYSYVVTNIGKTPLSSVIVTDDKCSPVLYVSGDLNTNNILETTEIWNYTCTTTLTVTTINIATVTGTDPGRVVVTDTDTATVTVADTGLSKVITGTSETFTSGNDVAIGEIVTYKVTMTLPAGLPYNNVVVTDRMDKGLAFVDCVSVTLGGTDITSIVCPPTVSAIDSPSNPANPGRQAQFNIGNIPASTTPTALVITYRAIVLDIIENQEYDKMNNSVTLTWDGGSFTTSAPEVIILEPDIDIEKDADPTTVTAGTSIKFTLFITHTSLSLTDAFDVVVTDVLPKGLEYVACTPITYSGVVPSVQPDPCNIPNGNTLQFSWDVLPLGQNATVTFFARYDGTKTSVMNSASVAWTSLPIDFINGKPPRLSDYNDTSTERWYDPEDLVNIYQIGDNVWINPPTLEEPVEDVEDLPTSLPATGFAPNVITTLPVQPANKAYTNTDVWVEIPSIGVNMPIVGVPLVEDEWDVSWLWNEAGWLNGTAFPGWQGNSALTGHITLPNGRPGPFAMLGNMQWGDKIIVHAYGTVYTYEVRETRTVSPDNVSILKHEEDSWITLITCKTYDKATNTYSRRTAVRAILVSTTTDKQTKEARGGR